MKICGRAGPLDRRHRHARGRGAKPRPARSHGSQPFGYAEARAAAPGGALDHLVHPAEFVGGQTFALIPAPSIAVPFCSAAAESGAARAPRRLRSPHRHAAGLWACVHASSASPLITGRATSAMWGFPLRAVPRRLDRRVRAGGARPRTLCPRRRLMGDRVCEFCHRLRRRLSGVAALRSSLSRGLPPFPAIFCPRRSRSVSKRRPGRSRLTSSARCGTAATSA